MTDGLLLLRPVMDLYGKIDAAVADVNRQTGLACPQGCGRCCEFPGVEATVLEMLPLAQHLHDTGRTDDVIEQLGADPSPVCIFYSAAPVHGGYCCGMYPFRPLVCRLFGSAAVRTKRGLEFAACAVMKDRLADGVACARRLLAEENAVPILPDWAARMASIDPAAGNRPIPINRAILAALERTGLEQSLVRQATRRDPDI